jgi:DNA-binding NtrC family response regulator
MKSILVVSSEEETFSKIRSCFPSTYRFAQSSNKRGALDTLSKARYDLIFVEITLLNESLQADGYKSALQSFWELCPSIEIIVMSPQEMLREAVMTVKAGASNYLSYPIVPEEVKLVTETALTSIIAQSELQYLRDQFWEAESLEIIETKSPLMKAVYDKVKSVAPTRSTVLLMGETGTGKGVLANLIHQHSNRRDSQFISVHCGAIPDTLLESELFGHEKGAFTGAVKRKLGKFEIASGGTLFLDEVGTITPSSQIKLLQILQDGTFQRVGGEVTLEADVRIIAATNADLKKMCEDGQFRKDLYYRLNVFPIEVPPLRERLEDIPHLMEGFLKRLNTFNTKEIRRIDPVVLEGFKHYSWPGNIRELENLIERAYILETSSMLTRESFPIELFEPGVSLATASADSSLTLAEVRRRAIENIERNYLKELLTQNEGRIKESAEAAGITTRQLHKLLAKYGIRKEEFKSPTVHRD